MNQRPICYDCWRNAELIDLGGIDAIAVYCPHTGHGAYRVNLKGFDWSVHKLDRSTWERAKAKAVKAVERKVDRLAPKHKGDA